MNKWKKQLPEGVQDYLPNECANKNEIIKAIEQLFYSWGYDRIETPSIEHIDVFAGSHFPLEKMFKLIDRNGRILVLRPDITLPIARLVSTKLKSMPQRLFYTGEVFSMWGAKEVTQSGIEFIGDATCHADAEVVIMAVCALQSTGLKDIQIELGQIEFFKGLMEEAGFNAEQTEELRGMIDQKDMLAVEIFLNKLSIPEKSRDILIRLPRLFGGKEILDEAEAMSSNPRCKNAVMNLRRLWALLSEYGLEDKISLDFGILHSINYYTGLVFRGLSTGFGTPVLTGGRYDNLLSEFGSDAPAIGFGVDISKIMLALAALGELHCSKNIDALITYQNGLCSQAFKLADELRKSGERVMVLHDPDSLDRMTDEKGVKKTYMIANGGVKIWEVG